MSGLFADSSLRFEPVSASDDEAPRATSPWLIDVDRGRRSEQGFGDASPRMNQRQPVAGGRELPPVTLG